MKISRSRTYGMTLAGAAFRMEGGTAGLRLCAGTATLFFRLLALFLLFFLATPFPAPAVPAGTVIPNTAAAAFQDGPSSPILTVPSNTVSITTVALRTPSTTEFLQYAPSMGGAQMVTVSPTDSSTSGNAAGPFVTLPDPVPAGGGAAIDLTSPVPLTAASLYHAGEPVFIRMTDLDQNIDPLAAETVLVRLFVDLTGDSELVRFVETGPNTGVFTGYTQSTSAFAAPNNGLLSLTSGCRITASYTDVVDNTDSSADAALVDPHGIIFSSTTGQPVDGATVTLINALTGNPATVFGDDGVSSFPASVTSGGTAVDSSGTAYAFPPGGYRFPFIAPGTYRLVVTPPAGYRAPSQVATAVLQALPGGPFAIVDPGSRGEDFFVNPGPAIQIDIPVDPLGSRLYLVKAAAKQTAAVGDFVPYRLTVENTDTLSPVLSVVVNDRLPAGFRYRSGSSRLNGAVTPDPAISADGRTLTFTIGDLAAGTTASISYVAEVSAGARPGLAVNTAVATGTGTASNTATAQVLITEELFRGKAFIVGRVMVDGCGNRDAAEEGGLAGVRLFMEDGTYVTTDPNGMYHFQGVTPGVHVVQLDLETVPEQYEVLVCEENSRFAGTGHSQFVDVQGGTLWRADFHLALKPPLAGDTGIELESRLTKGSDSSTNTIEYSVPIHVGGVALRNLRLTVMLPDGVTYRHGSSSLNAVPQPDPQDMENALTYRVGDVPAGWEGTVRFKASVPVAGNAGELATRALLTFDTPRKKDQRTPVVDNLLVRRIENKLGAGPDIVLHPRFASLSADLTAGDRADLDRVIKKMKKAGVNRIEVTGHTDSNRIMGRGTKKFKDNYALSRARAETVGRYIAAGLKLSPDQVTFDGRGPDEPVATNKTAAGRALNRRVELQIETVHTIAAARLTNEKDRSGRKTVATTGLRTGEKWAAMPDQGEQPGKQMPEFTTAWLDTAPPGLAVVWPEAGHHPPLPATKVAVKHDAARPMKLFVNGQEVAAFFLDRTLKRQDGAVGLSVWQGVPLEEGDNLFEAVQYDEQGTERAREKRVVHYSRPPVKAELVAAQSKLGADGKNPPVIAVRLTDREGHPAREGVVGEYSVQPPYAPLKRAEDLQKNPLVASTSDKFKFTVGQDGVALIPLEPTMRTGEAIVRLTLMSGVQEVRAWLTPEKRDWVLVGLAEGTVGYNTVKGNMENLAASGEDDRYYQDGRVAFYAKGAIKGEWLLTISYDSDRHSDNGRRSLYQAIDPNQYYTLYGDATYQNPDAASSEPLYLKIERDQFYALFGDFDTGLTVTELSRYIRQFTGVKSEMKSRRFDYTLFASQNDQAFIKDEIQGDGTSGLYRLSRKNIVINSETLVIETRNRFKSEVILASQPMTRHLDYTIDYDAGTVWFKSPVFSRDGNFNPLFIVVRYEVLDSSENNYTYGGRGAVRVLDNRVEIGATHVHEEESGGTGNLTGADVTVRLDEHTKVRAEVAATKSTETGSAGEGTAYLAELSHGSDRVDGKAYVREQEPGFGLGQQNGSETGTRKMGMELSYRLSAPWSVGGEVFRQENLNTGATRDVAEVRGRYSSVRYEFLGGLRYAEETFTTTGSQLSEQVYFGGRYQLSARTAFRVQHDQSVGGNNASSDYPTRTTVGIDYKLSETATLFGDQEWTWGSDQDSTTSRVGIKAAPWTGGQVSSTMEQQVTESGVRLFSTLGLKQGWQVNRHWTLDAGLDRATTFRHPGDVPFNVNVPPASGSTEDFTAVSLGAGYRQERWSWTGRIEHRTSDSEEKYIFLTGANGEPRPGVGLAAGLTFFTSDTSAGLIKRSGDLRLGAAYRPRKTRWIVLDRLDFLMDEQKGSGSDYTSRRLVNNFVANYADGRRVQVSLQYGAKYVLESIDNADYRGYTDLTGVELRYDLTKRWDIGARGSALHSWSNGQMDYLTSLSTGYNVGKNFWVTVGYNLDGFRDRDFSRADFTSEGPFIKFRLKFDQMSARDVIRWFTGQSGSR